MEDELESDQCGVQVDTGKMPQGSRWKVVVTGPRPLARGWKEMARLQEL